MKPTLKQIQEVAKNIADDVYPVHDFSLKVPHNKIIRSCTIAVEWAISQMQQEWVAISEREPAENQEVEVCFEHLVHHENGDILEKGVTSAIFSRTELLRPVFCKVNGWVVLGVTHWKPLSQPPTK